jgi:serine/threonine protein kinase
MLPTVNTNPGLLLSKLGPPWTPGSSFGNYTLLARVGLGGMAEIWLARQKGVQRFERVVVIKRILDSLANDESFVEMFLDEGRVAAQLSHPNIVQIFDLGEAEGAYYMVMEYLHGEDLAIVARAAKGKGEPIPLPYAMTLIARACEGLAHAHSRRSALGETLNIIHRDVSPQNIFVTYDGQVKLLDFGIAKALNRTSSTGQGQVKGKFAYMSPQQIAGDEVTQAPTCGRWAW